MFFNSGKSEMKGNLYLRKNEFWEIVYVVVKENRVLRFFNSKNSIFSIGKLDLSKCTIGFELDSSLDTSFNTHSNNKQKRHQILKIQGPSFFVRNPDGYGMYPLLGYKLVS